MTNATPALGFRETLTGSPVLCGNPTFASFSFFSTLPVLAALLCPQLSSQASEIGPKVWKGLIKSAYEKSKTAETVEQFSEVIQLCEKAKSAELTTQARDYVENLLSWVHNRRGELYVQKAAESTASGSQEQADRFDRQALADFKLAVGLNPAAWKPLHNRGVSFALAGMYEAAISDFSRVIEQKPNYANGWFNRAEIRYELGQYQLAVTDYTRSLELNTDDPGALNARGRAFVQLGSIPRGIQDYTKVIQLDRENTTAYVNRAEAYRSLRKWGKSAADYRQAISRGDNSVRAFQGAAWLMATCPDERYRSADLAVKAAEKAVGLSESPDANCLDTLAAALANAGRFTDAQSKLSEAIGLAATDSLPQMQARLKLYHLEKPFRDVIETAQVDGETEVR